MTKKVHRYICNNSACGHVEHTTHAPSTSKPCPKCSSSMIREDAR